MQGDAIFNISRLLILLCSLGLFSSTSGPYLSIKQNISLNAEQNLSLYHIKSAPTRAKPNGLKAKIILGNVAWCPLVPN